MVTIPQQPYYDMYDYVIAVDGIKGYQSNVWNAKELILLDFVEILYPNSIYSTSIEKIVFGKNISEIRSYDLSENPNCLVYDFSRAENVHTLEYSDTFFMIQLN